MGSRRSCALFVAGAVAVGAAGCGGGDDPKPGGFSLGTASPEAATSSTTSPAPSPSSTKDADGDYVLPGGGYDVLANMPPEAKERSRKGVVAFTTYFVHAVSKLQMKPATGQLPTIYTPECADCVTIEEGLATRIKLGMFYDALVYEFYAPAEPTPDPDQQAESTVSQGGMVKVHTVNTVDREHKIVRAEDASTGRMLLKAQAVWKDGQWRMALFDGNYVQ